MTEQLRRILIAEDDDEQRTALKLILKMSKYVVTEARDGQEAIDSVCQERPDLVLMDLSLPVLDGLEVTRELRGRAEFQNLPIIFVTGYDQQETIDSIRACGGTDFISKPIEFDDLRKMIENCLAAR